MLAARKAGVPTCKRAASVARLSDLPGVGCGDIDWVGDWRGSADSPALASIARV